MGIKTRETIAERIIAGSNAKPWGFEDFEDHPHVVEYRKNHPVQEVKETVSKKKGEK